jgi:hypothetical protein
MKDLFNYNYQSIVEIIRDYNIPKLTYSHMKLQLEERFLNNHKFHKQIMEKCLVCNSNEVFANQFGVLCKDCGTLLDFEPI